VQHRTDVELLGAISGAAGDRSWQHVEHVVAEDRGQSGEIEQRHRCGVRRLQRGCVAPVASGQHDPIPVRVEQTHFAPLLDRTAGTVGDDEACWRLLSSSGGGPNRRAEPRAKRTSAFPAKRVRNIRARAGRPDLRPGDAGLMNGLSAYRSGWILRNGGCTCEGLKRAGRDSGPGRTAAALSLARGMGPAVARVMGPGDGHGGPAELMPQIGGLVEPGGAPGGGPTFQVKLMASPPPDWPGEPGGPRQGADVSGIIGGGPPWCGDGPPPSSPEPKAGAGASRCWA